MVETGISEFTFGYAFLYEQTRANWANLTSAPVLPSLTDEQSKGWDANLPTTGADFYYQFKLSDYLHRSNARCMRDGHLAGPYYRFWLHRRDQNAQHGLLRSLSQSKPDTYYVAPQFTTKDTFNRAFLAGRMLDHSRLIPLAQCQDHNDEEAHYIAFRDGEKHWVEHSEATSHEESYLGRDVGRLIQASERRWRPITKEFAIQLVEELEEAAGLAVYRLALPPRPDFADASREQVLLHAANLASSVFGVTLVLAGQSG